MSPWRNNSRVGVWLGAIITKLVRLGWVFGNYMLSKHSANIKVSKAHGQWEKHGDAITLVATSLEHHPSLQNHKHQTFLKASGKMEVIPLKVMPTCAFGCLFWFILNSGQETHALTRPWWKEFPRASQPLDSLNWKLTANFSVPASQSQTRWLMILGLPHILDSPCTGVFRARKTEHIHLPKTLEVKT